MPIINEYEAFEKEYPGWIQKPNTNDTLIKEMSGYYGTIIKLPGGRYDTQLVFRGGKTMAESDTLQEALEEAKSKELLPFGA